MSEPIKSDDSVVAQYLAGGRAELDPGALAFFAQIDAVRSVDPEVAASIVHELADQRSNVKLIASENYSSLAVQATQGSLLTDKYAEGFPYHRFYAGCENVDVIEDRAAGLAKELFGADHAFVQPHSGADANLVAFTAILKARVESPALEKLGTTNPADASAEEWVKLRSELGNQRILGLDYYSGGHLTHGYRQNISSWMFDAHSYTVDPETKLIDLDALRTRLHEVRPLILLAGYSAYSRRIDFAKMRELADEVGAVLMVDMAHFAGLVAGRVFTGDFEPVAHAHVVTSTTHKTLRGPRGGLVLCTEEYRDVVDKACPTVLGGPLEHVIAAKALAFDEALLPSFRDYAARIVENAQALADGLQTHGVPVLTGGTDNHIVLADVFSGFGLSGRQAETALRGAHMTLNRNSLPFDLNGPWYASGLRLGTPAVTTLGMGPTELREIAAVVGSVLQAIQPILINKKDGTRGPGAKYEVTDAAALEGASARIRELLSGFPVYPEIDIDSILATPWGNDTLGKWAAEWGVGPAADAK